MSIIYTYQKSPKRKPTAKQRQLQQAWEELVEKFDLNRVHKAGAKFDPEKNKWFNHQYLVKQNDADLAKSFTPILAEKGFSTALEVTKLEKIISKP